MSDTDEFCFFLRLIFIIIESESMHGVHAVQHQLHLTVYLISVHAITVFSLEDEGLFLCCASSRLHTKQDSDSSFRNCDDAALTQD